MRVVVRLAIVGIILIVSIAMRVNSVIVDDESTMSLNDAIKNKFLSADVKGNGGHSGNCLKVSFKNLQNKKLALTIPAGTMFKPGDDECQNILVPQDQKMIFAANETRTAFVKGFCCEASDRSPGKDMAFTISANKDPKMIKLFNFLKGKNYSDGLLQEAIWCVSDNHEVSDVYAEKMEAIKPLRDELCKITGQKDTWYSTPKQHEVDEEGNISHVTTSVTGLIKFKALKAAKLHNEIFDSSDKLLVKNPNEFSLKPGDVEYEFNIRVGGWKKGTYYVKVFEGDKVIHKQEFKI